ncbi:MAG TPA: HEPN domain-containing protein [Anaerolineales bacterium]
MNELTKEWVDKAEADFYSADLLLHAGEYPLSEPACFHCQQCAEKYLKAYLQDNQVNFERKHDLMPLLALCVSLDEVFKSLKDDLQELDRYAVVVRYPGVVLKPETAESALKTTEKVRQFVRRKLNLK